jgi:hypothetical protein
MKLLAKLTSNESLKMISENTGTIGYVITIVLKISEELYYSQVPEDKRLLIILMKIMLKSAQNSLPYTVSNTSLKDIVSNNVDTYDIAFENIVLDLFEPNHFKDIDGIQNTSITKNSTIPDIPDHPAFIKFKDLLTQCIKEINNSHGYDIINIPRFLTEYNSNVILQLKEESQNVKENNDLKNLLHKWQIHQDFEKMFLFLENARNEYFWKNPVDEKSLSEYYVENKTYKVAKYTGRWGEDQIKEK